MYVKIKKRCWIRWRGTLDIIFRAFRFDSFFFRAFHCDLRYILIFLMITAFHKQCGRYPVFTKNFTNKLNFVKNFTKISCLHEKFYEQCGRYPVFTKNFTLYPLHYEKFVQFWFTNKLNFVKLECENPSNHHFFLAFHRIIIK